MSGMPDFHVMDEQDKQTSCATCATVAVVFLLLVIVLLLSTFATSVNAQGEFTWMWNCANPEGITVIETGRVIPQGERFEVYDIGEEFLKVIDGTINADYVCEVTNE